MADLIKDIKYEANGDFIMWRSPTEDFETGSVLTVNEAQTALFYLNGACVGELSAGRHVIETEKIPFLYKLFSSVARGKNIFHVKKISTGKVLNFIIRKTIGVQQKNFRL